AEGGTLGICAVAASGVLGISQLCGILLLQSDESIALCSCGSRKKIHGGCVLAGGAAALDPAVGRGLISKWSGLLRWSDVPRTEPFGRNTRKCRSGSCAKRSADAV